MGLSLKKIFSIIAITILVGCTTINVRPRSITYGSYYWTGYFFMPSYYQNRRHVTYWQSAVGTNTPITKSQLSKPTTTTKTVVRSTETVREGKDGTKSKKDN